MADWHAWYQGYENPVSSLSRRLTTVRAELARVLATRGEMPTQLLSMCAGDGRDTLPVLANGHADVRAVLVEIDPDLGAVARAQAAELALPTIEVRTADAGVLDTYTDLPPADVLLACGVFGNITDDDLETTVDTLPQLLAPGAAVLWTRGSSTGDNDPTRYPGDAADLVREVFARHEFVEETFIRSDEASFRVGVHRFPGPPHPHIPGTRLFRFMR